MIKEGSLGEVSSLGNDRIEKREKESGRWKWETVADIVVEDDVEAAVGVRKTMPKGLVGEDTEGSWGS